MNIVIRYILRINHIGTVIIAGGLITIVLRYRLRINHIGTVLITGGLMNYCIKVSSFKN